jgi:D-alanyl-D-alanine carboxypeptidase
MSYRHSPAKHSQPHAVRIQYGYQGVDGLKTGSSPTGGFNYIATVKQGDFRLIVV